MFALLLAALVSVAASLSVEPIATAAAADEPTASAINIPAAPRFDGLTTIQAVERLSNYGDIYKAAIEQINGGEAAGTISASRAGQLRATVAARIRQLNSNYFAWRDAYDKSVSPGSGGPDENSGSGAGGSDSGAGSKGGGDSGSGSGNQASAGIPGVGKTESPGSGDKKGRGDGGRRGGGGHGSPNTRNEVTGPPHTGGAAPQAKPRRSNATLRAASASGVDDANGASKRGGSSDAGAGDEGGSLVDEMRRRTTVARAVDAVPLGLRLLLLALLFTIATLSAISLRERRRSRNVERVAQLDYLTGLANREGFDRMLSLEWRRAARYGRPLGLVFVDLDHFKLYNDTYGHLAGDRLLREVAAALGETARGSDFTARLGGDEFVILCPEATEEGLVSLKERLREEVSSIEVTLSIGYALQRPDDIGPDDLVSRADGSMYRAKDRRRRPVSVGNPMLGSLRRTPRD